MEGHSELASMIREARAASEGNARPTVDEIRTWPATVSVSRAAAAFGVSTSHAYECVKTDTLPARTLKVGGRIVVVTSSILAAIEGGGEAA